MLAAKAARLGGHADVARDEEGGTILRAVVPYPR